MGIRARGGGGFITAIQSVSILISTRLQAVTVRCISASHRNTLTAENRVVVRYVNGNGS